MPDKGSLEKQEARSGQNKVEVDVKECAIHSVVVYQDRAEVRRVVPANLAAGENEVIINGLAECVDKDSIRCVCVLVCHFHTSLSVLWFPQFSVFHLTFDKVIAG